MGAKGNGHDLAVPMAAETLKGDFRSVLLEFIKHLPKPWAKSSEGEQKSLIARADQCSEEVIHKAVMLIAARERKHVTARVKKVSITDKGCELTFDGLPATDSAALNVALLQGKRVLLIDASATEFLGERAPAKADPDQPDLLKGDAKGSPFKVEKGGKVKLPSAVAAEIGDRLITEGSSVVEIPVRAVADLRKELARAPHRIEIAEDTGVPVYCLTLGDEILRLKPYGKEQWEIAEHSFVGEHPVTFAGRMMSAKKVAAFIREWVASCEAAKEKKPPVGPMPAKEEAAATGAE